MKSCTGKLNQNLQAAAAWQKADCFFSDTINALNTGINKRRLRIKRKPEVKEK